MWSTRIANASLFLFIQLLFLSDVLNGRASVANPDTDWVATFSPTILYFVLAGLLIFGNIFQGIWLRTSDSPKSEYLDRQAFHASVVRKKKASVVFFDSLVDLVLLGSSVMFMVLTIRQLEALDAGTPLRSWQGETFGSLYFICGILFVVWALASRRVAMEYKYQRLLENSEAFGCCCSVSPAQDELDSLALDKKPMYAADAEFHNIPCVFVGTPAMTFGCPDYSVAIALFSTPLVIIGVLVALGARLDGADISLTTVFVALFVLEALIILFSIFTLMSLFLCFRGRGAQSQKNWPQGRYSIRGKYLESFMLIWVSVLFMVQQILLENQIDGTLDGHWVAVFIPALLVFGTFVIMGCCRCWSKAPSPPVDRGGFGGLPSSMWGAFE